MATTQTLTLQISDNARQAATNIRSLTNALTRLQNALNPAAVTNMANQLQRLAQVSGIANLQTAINTLNQSVNTLNASIGALANQLNHLPGGSSGGSGGGQGGGGGNNGPFGPLIRGSTTFTQAIQNIRNRFAPLTRILDDFRRNVVPRIRDAFNGLHAAVGRIIAPITGLLHTFGRVATMRLFRYIIRQITTAFREGLEHVREYSKAINGLYAKDMAELDNKLLKVTNSLGAALAPAIQALLPTVHQFANYLIDAANAFNQFMALLNGHSSWTRAIDVVAEDFENTEKSANGAAKAAKNLLASWDELNIIQSKAANGGGGSGKKDAYDYTKMFEEVYEFDSGVVRFFNFVEDHLNVVLGLLATIGLTLLGVNAFATAAIVSIGLTFAFSEDILENGITEDNIGDLIRKNLIAAIAGAGFGWHVGGVPGAILGAITGFTLGVIIDLLLDFQHALNVNDIPTAIRDGLLIGAGGALLGGLFAGFAGGSIMLGGLAGFAVGAAVTVYVLYTDAIAKNDVATAFGAGLGLVSSTSIAGAAIGAMIGHPIIGAFVGLAVGALLTVIGAFTVDREATEKNIVVSNEELQRIVNANVFTIEVSATISKINATILNAEEARKDVATALTETSLAFNIISLGINDSQSYQNLYDAVFDDEVGLIARLNKAIDAQKDVVKLSFTLVPVDGSAGFILSSITGWEGVQTYVTDAGKELSKLLSKGIQEGLTEEESAMVSALLTTISNVSSIVARADARKVAEANLMQNLRSDDMTFAQAVTMYSRDLENSLANIELSGVIDKESLAAIYSGMAVDEQARYDLLVSQGKEAEAARHLELAAEYNRMAADYTEDAARLREEFNKGTARKNVLYEDTAPGRELIRSQLYQHQNYAQTLDFAETAGLATNLMTLLRILYNEDTVNAAMSVGITPAEMLTEEQRRVWANAYLPTVAQSGLLKEADIETLFVEKIESSDGRTNADIPSVPDVYTTPEAEREAKGTSGVFRRRGNQYTVIDDSRQPIGSERPATLLSEQNEFISKITNREQEISLLRQQNDLLRQILNKPMVAQVSVSSALGRTVKQSMDLWDRTSGNTRSVSID